MNYGQIYNCDTANGPGMRVTLFVSGCTHHCKECFNEETWNFSYGEEFTEKEADSIVEMLKASYIDGLTLLGGEPMEPANQEALLPLLKRIKTELPGKSIWLYSGFTFEQLTGIEQSHCRCGWTDEILSLCDILVDGEFHIDQKNVMLQFRGSSNQRVLDLKTSLEKHEPVWMEKYR